MKTLLAIITAITALISSFGAYKTGDVNNDKRVNAEDILIIQQYCVGERELTRKQLKAADCNHDGKVDSQDVLWIYENGDITK